MGVRYDRQDWGARLDNHVDPIPLWTSFRTHPSIAGDLSGRELPRDRYLRVMGSRGGLLGPQRSAWAWWPLSLSRLS